MPAGQVMKRIITKTFEFMTNMVFECLIFCFDIWILKAIVHIALGVTNELSHSQA